jgi:hypothetical protein
MHRLQQRYNSLAVATLLLASSCRPTSRSGYPQQEACRYSKSQRRDYLLGSVQGIETVELEILAKAQGEDMSNQLHYQFSQREKLQGQLFDDIRRFGGSTMGAAVDYQAVDYAARLAEAHRLILTHC